MGNAIRALALTFTCMLSLACAGTVDGATKEGDACEAMEECGGVLICSGGRCRLPCNRDDECAEGRFCSSGLCAATECGNGVREGEEQCDAGQQNADSGACTAGCTVNVCGDAKLHAGVEECDEGPRNSDTNPDACRTTCELPRCGDGVQDLGEACDDGYTDGCGSCNADCSGAGSGPGVCGDRIRCPEHEFCDDGYTDACGSCNADCSDAGSGSVCGDGTRCPEYEVCDDGYRDACGSCNGDCDGPGEGPGVCGDGARCPEFEACDDGPLNSDTVPDACRTACKQAHCGDGVEDSAEVCDDGYTDACGSCGEDCSGAGSGAVCGDGARCPELEACDDGPLNSDTSPDACRTTCQPAHCGDGVEDSGEGCDDGYIDACGSCNEDCSSAGSGAVCGDGSRCPELEACDDGYSDVCGSCNADCTGAGSGAVCGDGTRCPELETCDDGYSDACGSCNADCTGAGSGAVCGDGTRCPELEVCDDGNSDACGSCNTDCTGPGGVCGDGVWCPESEACDDGYADACGSCNADCSGAGSGSVCGDGVLCREYETCDDSNTTPGDGCTAWCSEDTGCGDASCNSHAPRFAVTGEPQFSNSEGSEPTVSDAKTGLMWQGCPAGLSGSACSTGDAAEMVWGDAVTYCIDLVWNGLGDWYLPDEYELQSIVDYGVGSPAVDSAEFPATSNKDFWTSSSYANGANYAWYVNFGAGDVGLAMKDDYGNSARCVRRAAISELKPRRFVRTGGSQPVVRDDTTGLIWQGCEAGLSGDSCETGTLERYVWEEARAYCDSLEWAGVSDWDLPGVKELRSIVDNQRSAPALDVAAFPGTTAPYLRTSYFWTSSSRVLVTDYAWGVAFLSGAAHADVTSNLYRVRCVRRGQ